MYSLAYFLRICKFGEYSLYCSTPAVNERELISYLKNRFEKPKNLVSSWMGEDCEVLEIGDPERYLLISIDTSSERADFPSDAPPFEIGYFSAALSLSDIAACSGEPVGVQVSCSIPPGFGEKIYDVYEGIRQAVSDAGTSILGGDTNAAGEFSLSIVSLGQVKKDDLLVRRGAKSGDIMGVTGILDRFNYGYFQYTKNKNCDFESMLRQAPQIRTGFLLGELGCVTSCIDLPDGLIKTLEDNVPSGLGFLIDDKSIPIGCFGEESDNEVLPNYVYASNPAGDLQLLFTVPSHARGLVETTFSKENLPVYWIGEVVSESGIKINIGDRVIHPTVEGFIHRFEGFKLFP